MRKPLRIGGLGGGHVRGGCLCNEGAEVRSRVMTSTCARPLQVKGAVASASSPPARSFDGGDERGDSVTVRCLGLHCAIVNLTSDLAASLPVGAAVLLEEFSNTAVRHLATASRTDSRSQIEGDETVLDLRNGVDAIEVVGVRGGVVGKTLQRSALGHLPDSGAGLMVVQESARMIRHGAREDLGNELGAEQVIGVGVVIDHPA
jgi:hypothetical protein